jgi:hypothetical protein
MVSGLLAIFSTKFLIDRVPSNYHFWNFNRLFRTLFVSSIHKHKKISVLTQIKGKDQLGKRLIWAQSGIILSSLLLNYILEQNSTNILWILDLGHSRKNLHSKKESSGTNNWELEWYIIYHPCRTIIIPKKMIFFWCERYSSTSVHLSETEENHPWWLVTRDYNLRMIINH